MVVYGMVGGLVCLLNSVYVKVRLYTLKLYRQHIYFKASQLVFKLASLFIKCRKFPTSFKANQARFVNTNS